MFTPAQMRKVNIFLQEQDVEAVTVALARHAMLDLNEGEQQAWGSAEPSRWSDLAATYTSQSRRLEQTLETLGIDRPPVTPPEQLEPGQDADLIAAQLHAAAKAVQDWQVRQEAVEKELEHLDLLVQQMQLLQPLHVSLEELRQLQFLHLVVGSIPRESLDNLQVVLFRLPFVIVPVHTYDERVLIFAATDQAHVAILERALRSVFLQPLELPDELSGTAAEVITTLQERRAEVEQQRKALAQERRQLADNWRETLLSRWCRARSNAAVTRTISRLGYRREIYLMTGWVAAHDLEHMIRLVRELTEDRGDIEVIEPRLRGEREVPTLLRNPPFLRPFEQVVSTFGFPTYDELDPTPLVALTFMVMFGMMFGDVGHGLLLMLAALGLRWWGKINAVADVLLASGAGAMVFGLLYGSLFGREDILPHVWLSPLNSILSILIAAVIFGVVLLNIGFGLHLISATRTRRWGALLFSRNGLAGIWLYWTLAGGILALVLGAGFPLLLWLILLVIPIALLLLNEPLSRLITGERPLLDAGWGEYSVQAFFELFEAFISYISNSFSFIRLGAFAVAHAGLSQVVFLLADAGGGVWRWLIILLGTLVIVAFEGLIIGIQTLRLEYYEFFGKFFQGRGRAFRPLRLLDEAERV